MEYKANKQSDVRFTDEVIEYMTNSIMAKAILHAVPDQRRDAFFVSGEIGSSRSGPHDKSLKFSVVKQRWP